jgi:hypothetical protein
MQEISAPGCKSYMHELSESACKSGCMLELSASARACAQEHSLHFRTGKQRSHVGKQC